MIAEQDIVRAWLVAFQRQIAQLTREQTEQREAFASKQHDLILGLLELADAFDMLEELIVSKEEEFDKSSRQMAKNVRAVHRKLMRLLKARHVVPMELAGTKASMETCKVIDTQDCADQEEETVLAVMKKGYVETTSGDVMRKAEVVTCAAPH